MSNFWKIGTSIKSYIFKDLAKWVDENPNDKYFVIRNEDNKNIQFEFKNNKYKLDYAKAHQLVRTLLTFNFLYDNSEVFMNNEADSVEDKKVYFINEIIKKITEDSKSEHFGYEYLKQVKKFDDDEYMGRYNQEREFIMSVAYTYYYELSEKNSKFINLRLGFILSKKDMAHFKYLAEQIKQSEYSNEIDTLLHSKVLGHSQEVDKVLNSIGSIEPIKSTKDYKEKILKDEIQSETMNFANFIENYFTTKNIIQIPIYQRRYVWDERLINALLNDFKNIEKSHYIGNIIVKLSDDLKTKTHINKLIDGQQRLTTMLLLFRAFMDYCSYHKWSVPEIIVRKLYVNPIITRSFLYVVGNNDLSDFRAFLEGKHENAKNISNLNIAYHTILNWLSMHIINETEASKYWDNILENVLFLLITDYVSNEFKLFEKLNTGSKPLTPIQLLQNFIFEWYIDNEMGDAEKQDAFETKVLNKIKHNKIDGEKFFIAILKSKVGKLNDDTLFNQYRKMFCELVPKNTKLTTAIDVISHQIDIYSNATNYQVFKSSSNHLYPIADYLFMFNGREIYLPIVLRLIEWYFDDIAKKDLKKIEYVREFLKVIEIFEVRLQVANYRGQSLSGKMEKVLEEFTIETTPKELWKLMTSSEIEGSNNTSNAIGSIAEFEEKLKKSKISNKAAKLIMFRLENYLSKGGWEYKKESQWKLFFEKIVQREHLLPKKWKQHWEKDILSQEGINADNIDIKVSEAVDLIGNAFPMPDWSNNAIKNASLEDKIKVIENEDYKKLILFSGTYTIIDDDKNTQIVKLLQPINGAFTLKEIEARSVKIANIAASIWIDYE